jgi:hypothetical protein
MKIERYKQTRFWAVLDKDGTLIAVCVYKRGAREVLRRLTASDQPAEHTNR